MTNEPTSTGKSPQDTENSAAGADATVEMSAISSDTAERDTPVAGDAVPQASRPSTKRRAGIMAGSVVAVLAAGYGVGYAMYGGELAQAATVAGVEVGGMSPEAAEDKLAEELPELLANPIVMTVADGDETTYEVVPEEAGLGIDVPATVAAVPGGSANPIDIFRAITGGEEVQPVPVVQRDKLEAALTGIADEADVEPVNGAVAFDEGEVVTSEPVLGRAIDIVAATEVVESAFFGADGSVSFPIPDIALPANTASPDITQAEVDRAVREFAAPAMSGPVSVIADGKSVDLEPEIIAQALKMVPDGNTLQPELDGKELSEVGHEALGAIGQEGKDATIVIENNQPVVVGEERGLGIAPDDLSAAVLDALTRTGDARAAEVELTEVDPELTSNLVQELGVKEIVSETTTYFPYAEYRNTNIGLAAEKIDNTLLKPDDTFSLNGLVGERTAANGFAIGGIISGGQVVEDYGGGVSQVATTTYNAAFKAGLEDVEHRPHSIYFDRYPIAQEATVSWGNFDMSFKNDTPYGIVVDTVFTAASSSSQGVLTIKLWSTPYYEVETSVSDRSNFTSPQTVYNADDNCIPNASGHQGFDITSYRKVWDPDGNLVKDEAFPWTYRPNPKVVCGEKPKNED